MEGDVTRMTNQRLNKCFNPRPRMEGDLVVFIRVIDFQGFNPRPRMEGDPVILIFSFPWGCFNPRPRMEGDIRYRNGSRRHGRFNPRPRMEGDLKNGRGRLNIILVSIHAPAWRATLRQYPGYAQNLFQSTPPHGGRPGPSYGFSACRCFNPRPRMEGDVCRSPAKRPAGLFQSTPPHGGRPASWISLTLPYPVSIHAPAWRATFCF